jgi:hypothetical protein
MALKPWYNIVYPREDLREGRPLDAAEFAVHLDQVRDGRAPPIYQNAQQFFERTYLTRNLTSLGAEAIRRLSGIQTETSAVFNFITQFGGGKTHALTLLYHLARGGQRMVALPGVQTLLARAGVSTIPQAAIAVFVGTEFDTTRGRGGSDGTPIRKTPWGEIAYQLRGEEGLALVADHEQQMIAPAGDVIREMLPTDRPCLILMDELLTYASRNRKLGMANQLYHFIQSLSETVRGSHQAVLAISIPKSLMEMTPEDETDYDRLEKLLNRLGKAVILSAEHEISEIIRRRLFEWDMQQVGQGGQVVLPRDALKTCNEYANWVLTCRQFLPNWFPVDHTNETFAAAYPFHPTVLSVFERKWQGLPRFQRTRGVLRMLALWVSHAYQQGYTGAHRDPLIDLGTAPLDDPTFRAAVFEQIGESKLEVPVTTDICGSNDAHALRMDSEAVDTIRKGRLHRKVATTIFFESNGGQARGYASLPEVRLGVAAPDLDLTNVETVLDGLAPPDGTCYYLHTEKNRYWFSIKPTLTRILADRKAGISPERIRERLEEVIPVVFRKQAPIQPIFFPDSSNQIPDRPALAIVVMDMHHAPDVPSTLATVEKMTRECGTSGRTYKSGLIWVLADGGVALKEEARKLLAWEAIQDEQEGLRLDDQQRQQVAENVKRSENDLRECVWRSYHTLVLLDKTNALRTIDLGLIHSSAAPSLVQLIISYLRQDGEIVDDISPNYLIRNWPPAFTEWSTKDVRDAFFASPRFPRLMNGDAVRETIAKGVMNGFLAYVGRAADGKSYTPFYYCPASGKTSDIPPENQRINSSEVEISSDMYIIARETAEAYLQELQTVRTLSRLEIAPQEISLRPGDTHLFAARGFDQDGDPLSLQRMEWNASGGTITQDGVFTAGKETGRFAVSATAGNTSTQATVTITEDIHLARLVLEPSQVVLSPGKQQQFTLKGYDQHGCEMVITSASWTCTGGTLSQDGVFVAGNEAGRFAVTVVAEGVNATASVTIEQRGARKVTWRGEISPQQWMNFYTKAASKFVINQGLKFTVQMEVAPPEGLTEHQIETLKLALRELGLDDAVTVEGEGKKLFEKH